MSTDEIFKSIAPCGLNCSKCVFFKDGEISAASHKLLDLLGNFAEYAKRFSQINPVLENYNKFQEIANFLKSGKCEGCRSGKCHFNFCKISPCIKSKGHDFCYECEEFPCEKGNLNESFYKKWVEFNTMIKDKGLESFYALSKEASRYP